MKTILTTLALTFLSPQLASANTWETDLPTDVALEGEAQLFDHQMSDEDMDRLYRRRVRQVYEILRTRHNLQQLSNEGHEVEDLRQFRRAVREEIISW